MDSGTTAQLCRLVNMDDPYCVFGEVKTIVSAIYPEFDFETVERVFADVINLFNGNYPGYRKCNTRYHNLKHTTDAMLAMTRLMHGAVLAGKLISRDNIFLGIVSALLHDTGYIQEAHDTEGTGAQYTLVHITRSIEFMKGYFRSQEWASLNVQSGEAILCCTGLNAKIDEILFESGEVVLLGKMMGSADLLGQMADSTYLEKLPALYQEFVEGQVSGYGSELDLLKTTPSFYRIVQQRFAGEFSGVNRFMTDHFRERWGIEDDLYQEAIEENVRRLEYILLHHADDYHSHL